MAKAASINTIYVIKDWRIAKNTMNLLFTITTALYEIIDEGFSRFCKAKEIAGYCCINLVASIERQKSGFNAQSPKEKIFRYASSATVLIKNSQQTARLGLLPYSDIRS